MNKYVIHIPTEIKDHRLGQKDQRMKLGQHGARWIQWLSSVSRSDGYRYHTWRIHCDEQTLTMLILAMNARMVFG